MKALPLALSLILGFAGSSDAINKSELDSRILALTAKFEAMQQRPDRCIPAEQLRNARGIILLDRTKAGFLFAYQGGGGVALVKDAVSGKWSPASFVSADEASLGFQVGGQQAFFVILLMDTNVTRLLIEPQAEFGGEARGTAGDSSSGVEARVTPTIHAVLVYDDRRGLFAGAAIKGGAIAPDAEANRIYYGQLLTAKDILFGKKVTPSEVTARLIAKLSQDSSK